MNSLDENTKILLKDHIKDTISTMVWAYVNYDEVDLDMELLAVLKKTFDSLWRNRPFDDESRVYLKTLATKELLDGLMLLKEMVGDHPIIAKKIDGLITWYHVAKDV